MRLVAGDLCWSATDLTVAAQCEHSLLRRLDELLRRGEPRPEAADPLRDQVARIGDLHEQQVRRRLEAEGHRVVELPRPGAGASYDELAAMHDRTVDALRHVDGVVHQAGFFDSEFSGFADFIVATAEGWQVGDAKLARQVRPSALLQLGAYAEQLERAGLPMAPTARLMLGDGSDETFPLSDVMPVYRERRDRLRLLLDRHALAPGPVAWGSDDVVACGRCPDCEQAVRSTRDVLLVAGVRMSQRKLLREVGVRTIDDLAAMSEPPPHLVRATADRLVAQARLQVRQLATEAAGEPRVFHEVVGDGGALRRLPAPSPGDVFFDFEGDPLHREADPHVWGIEYLWGVTEAPVDGVEPEFRRWWAHTWAEERAAFEQFMDYVAERRQVHPDMHVYHYAPYETTALKRLAGRYATRQEELDDLLRSAVFVDLYAVVRGSVRVSQPSYSIKLLEPLYMPRDRTQMAVAAGDVSIAEYHEARALLDAGDRDAARTRLRAIEDYNRYDCESTLGLRDWLLRVIDEHGVAADVAPLVIDKKGEPSEEQDELVQALRARSGPAEQVARTPEQQAVAMVASAVGYHRRETLPFWWEHFTRLATEDVEDWRPDRDVFRVDSCEVLEPWHLPEEGRATNQRRRLRLTGRWGPGSTPGRSATVVYRLPCPPGAKVPDNCPYGTLGTRDITVSSDDEGVVEVLEVLSREAAPYDATPVALVPSPPPGDATLRDAVREVAEQVLAADGLPPQPALEVLRRRPPKLASLTTLPHSGVAVDDLVATLLDLDHSSVPVQGPPGTGKTWTGSRVVRRLVEQHGWRVGVVAQSHAVVENMLSAVVRAGLDPALVGKQGSPESAPWSRVGKGGAAAAAYLEEHQDTGCVLGGTAWTFTNPAVERGSLDLLVIDEAGQFSLANTVAVSVVSPRLLLLGDPQQLPQVSQGTHDEPVHLSALRWVMGERQTLPRELGYFLGDTYRMHPALCDKVSTLSYGGELASAEVTVARHLDGVEPGLRTVMLEGTFGNSVASDEEAEVVVAQVRDLLGRSWHDPGSTPADRPLAEADVLVVAPYNAQVQLLRRRLREAGHADVRVGTVDRFQGQEAPVVIVSMTASSPADVPRGMGFLLNRNRVNVAISRAQWAAVLVRSVELTAHLPRSAHGVLDLGAFIGLSGPASPSPAADRPSSPSPASRWPASS
jgi:predicted RecB family nuclease